MGTERTQLHANNLLSSVNYHQVILGSTVFGLAFFFAPGIPPYNFEFTSYQLKPPIHVETSYVLDKAELYINGTIVTPESIAVRGNEVFTGDGRGRIYRIRSSDDIQMIAEYGYECAAASPGEKAYNEKMMKKCSYPLGFRLSPNGELFFTDPFKGVLKIDPDTGDTEVIIDMSEPIEGKLPLVPEDLDVTKDGTIYWTDGSTVNPIGNFQVDAFVQPTGRLLKYDPVSKKSSVLLDNIYFSNGVQLAADESFVLVAETIGRKISRYYIAGEKNGTSNIFIDGLPGYPDNLRSNGKGGFYIALAIPRNENFTLTSEILSGYPLARRFMTRVRHLLREIVHFVTLNGCELTNQLLDYIGSYGPFFQFSNLPKIGLVLEVDGDGNPVRLLQSTKEMAGVSQFTIGPEYAYTTTPLGNEIWRIKLSDLE